MTDTDQREWGESTALPHTWQISLKKENQWIYQKYNICSNLQSKGKEKTQSRKQKGGEGGVTDGPLK